MWNCVLYSKDRGCCKTVGALKDSARCCGIEEEVLCGVGPRKNGVDNAFSTKEFFDLGYPYMLLANN
jgi:hypothetical protein